MLQALGITGATIVLISMMIPSTHRKQNIIMRAINIIGSIMLAWYSFKLNAYSTGALNIIVSFVNIFYICKLLTSMKKDGKSFFRSNVKGDIIEDE